VSLVAVAAAIFAHSLAPPATCLEAVAIRDHVPAYQEVGTAGFTLPLLSAIYTKHFYVTGADGDDGYAHITEALRQAKRDNCAVDLFFLELGGPQPILAVERLAPEERPRLHMVYDTGGGGGRFAERWLDAGAETFVGHMGNNVAPIFYTFFLPKLAEGKSVDVAVAEANHSTWRVMMATGPIYSAAGWNRDVLWENTEAHVFRATSVRGAREDFKLRARRSSPWRSTP